MLFTSLCPGVLGNVIPPPHLPSTIKQIDWPIGIYSDRNKALSSRGRVVVHAKHEYTLVLVMIYFCRLRTQEKFEVSWVKLNMDPLELITVLFTGKWYDLGNGNIGG